MTPALEFYFFVGSTYTYLSVQRASALAAQAGVALAWKPFSVRAIMREQNNSPFNGKPVKMRYMWRDIERRARRFGLPFTGAAPYPIDAQLLANHLATLAAGEGWCEAFTRAAYQRWFLRHEDPGQAEVLRELLQGLGRDADDCLSRAALPAVAAQFEANTQRARELGIFGSPTFVCGDEVFWGDDRLEDALDWCRERGVA